MKTGLKRVSLLVVILLVTMAALAARSQALTGDEPRYVMYASSILDHGRPVMTQDEWAKFAFEVVGVRSAILPAAEDGTVLMNSLYLPVLLSPIAHFWKVAGLRAFTLLVGIVGLGALYKLCCRVSEIWGATLGIAVAGLSIPLLPYLHLFYMETYIFALVCVTWERLHGGERSVRGDFFTALLILAIPFVHLRGSAVAVVLFGLLIERLYRRRLFRRIAGVCATAGVAFGLLLLANEWIYGSIIGSVTTARPPTPSQSFAVLAMQLFNVRHGLLAYAPVWLLGYTGLWLSPWARNRIGIEGLIMATCAALTGIGVNPGECWPARFWVLSIPMLTVGFSLWWSLSRSLFTRTLAGGLIAFTLMNTAVFLIAPDMFLENRQSSSTYQFLFDHVGKLHFGLALPVEVDDADNLAAARNLTLGAFLTLVCFWLAAAKRNGFYAIPAGLLLAIALDLCRVSVVPPSLYETRIDLDKVTIDPHKSISAGYLQMGNRWETWFVPPAFVHFGVTYVASAVSNATELSANQVVSFACHAPISSLVIGAPVSFDVTTKARVGITLYQSRSTVLSLFHSFQGDCAPVALRIGEILGGKASK